MNREILAGLLLAVLLIPGPAVDSAFAQFKVVAAPAPAGGFNVPGAGGAGSLDAAVSESLLAPPDSIGASDPLVQLDPLSPREPSLSAEDSSPLQTPPARGAEASAAFRSGLNSGSRDSKNLSPSLDSTGPEYAFTQAARIFDAAGGKGSATVTPASTPQERIVLVTGFEPFDEFGANASQHVAESLHARRFQVQGRGAAPATFRIVGRTLPVSFEGAKKALEDAIREHSPDVVLMLGLSGRTPNLEVESVARNLRHSPDFPDADGARPNAAPVVAGAPEALVANAPVEAIVSSLRSQGLPALLSRDAGLFVCNSSFYSALYEASVSAASRITAFVHLPPAAEHLSPEQRTRIPHWPIVALERASGMVVQWLAHAATKDPKTAP